MDSLLKEEKKQIKNRIQLDKWKRRSEKKKPRIYFLYFIFIICLAYVVDEIASNLNFMMQNEVFQTFFGGDETLKGKYTLVFTIVQAISFFTFFYKVLADRFGRKPFLVINTLFLTLGMFICSFAPNLPFYLVGSALIYFFIPCDVQVIYILETAPEKRKAFSAAVGKAVGVCGIALVPVLRNWAITFNWQLVFLIPACIGVIAGILGFCFVKESDVFIQTKIEYYKNELKKKKEVEKPSKRDTTKSQGGLISGVKYMLQNKVLLWLFLIALIFSICIVAINNYAFMIEQEGESYSANDILVMMVTYPFVYAGVELFSGILADKAGRKTAIMISGSLTFIGILCFVVGIKSGWQTPILIGAALGIFTGGYFSSVDTLNVITVEHSPTNLRSSIMSIISVALSVGSLLATLLYIGVLEVKPDLDIGFFCLLLLAPALFFALLLVALKMPQVDPKKNTKKVKNNELKKESDNINIDDEHSK